MTAHWAARLAPGALGGIHRAEPEDEAAITAAGAGIARLATLDAPASKPALLDALATRLAFPAWFGRNWDALEELLRAPDPPDERAIVLLWHDPSALPNADRATARRLFRTVATERRAAGARPLLVLLFDAQRHVEANSVRETAIASTAHEGPTRLPPPGLQGLGRIHHVALVVRSIEATLPIWRDVLGLPLSAVADIPSDGVRIAFLDAGGTKIELVEPTGAGTGVERFLEARGEGFHHVCLEVPDLAASLADLAGQGIELIDAAPRRGAEGPVAFLHPRSTGGVLVELIEAPGGPAWDRLGFSDA